MIPKECKRLAEVDFPIAVVSKHAAKEKSIRYGHPSTLHLWWARRPLAACRAMLLGLLLPDPCDQHCPEEFKQKAHELLPKVQGAVGPKDEDLRKSLLKFIGDFANWDLSSDRTYLEVSRELVKAAHSEETPLVVDPFAGGGSIPLEALRLGCETFASDLNPVACLILKVMLEDIPRYGGQKVKVKKQNGEEVGADGLADALRIVGKDIKEAAEKELSELYPKDPDGATPIAYLWARSVRCESPNCGAEIPLVRSFWLSKKADRKRALKYRVKRQEEKTPEIEFQVFEPHTDADVSKGTVSRGNAACPACNMVLRVDRVRGQLTAQRGGADVLFDTKGSRMGGARLLAVVLIKAGDPGRDYRLPTECDYDAVRKAQARVVKILDKWERGGKHGLCPVPDESLPPIGTLGFRVQRYGILQWGDLFTARQKAALVMLSTIVARSSHNGAANEIAGLALSRLTDIYNAQGVWETTKTQVRNLFSRQAIAMRWDFAEASACAEQAGDYQTTFETMVRVAERLAAFNSSGQVQQADAASSSLPDETVPVWFTDPPYYDAIPYSDLADFFYVWLKRALPNDALLRDSSDSANPLTPKLHEAVQDETKRDNGRVKDRAWFEEKMAKAFAEGRRVLREDGIGSVVFAHKTTEGWEALLSGMIRGGWTITGSWPIATEMATRMRARDSAALATSVHLVCRPRTHEKIGDWQEMLRELPKRVGDWMERLQSEGIRGADLVFACIGPALEIYSRYSRVVDAEDREIPLGGDPEATEPHKRGYLAYVWEAVGRAAFGAGSWNC